MILKEDTKPLNFQLYSSPSIEFLRMSDVCSDGENNLFY